MDRPKEPFELKGMGCGLVIGFIVVGSVITLAFPSIDKNLVTILALLVAIVPIVTYFRKQMKVNLMEARHQQKVLAAKAEGKTEVECPYCGEKILLVAIKCKHCGSKLKTDDPL